MTKELSRRDGVIIATVGALLILGALVAAWFALATTAATEATVTGTSVGSCQVEFTTGGQGIRTEIGSSRGSDCRYAEIGDQVNIHYDPDDPAHATDAGGFRRWGAPVVMAILGPWLVVGGVKLARARRSDES